MKNFAIIMIFVWILLMGCFGVISANDNPVNSLSVGNDLDTYIQNWEENYEKELEEAGISPEEASQYGYRSNPLEDLFPAPEVSMIASLTAGNLPESYDLRDYGRVSSVKNQGSYGTCWAFSVMNSIESSLITQNIASSDIDLSERHLAYFTYNRGNDPLGNLTGDLIKTKNEVYYSNGFNNIFTPFILSSWTGPVLESQAPYNETPWTNLSASLQYGNDAFHVKNIYRLNINSDQDGVKNAIQTYGAGVVAYLSKSSYYHTGTYNSENYTSYYYPSSTSSINHSVSIIGWDDNFPKENFINTPRANGAWLVKQSWGSAWKTQNGYFWLSYYDNSLEDTVYFYEAEAADIHQRCYQYDGSASYYTVYNDKMANIFTVPEDETISAVSFGTTGSDYEYTVKVYTGCTESNPESGTLAATATGIIGNEYIKTVDLPNNVSVNQGERFSVVVDLGDGYNGPYLVDRTISYSWVQFTSYGCPHQSFYYASGKWYDMNSSCSSNAVIARIKAYSTETAVNGLKAAVNNHTADLSWNAFSNAASYEVYQSAASTTGFTKIGTISDTSFSINNLAYGSTWYFKVRAVLQDGTYSDYSGTLSVTVPVPSVTGLKAVVNGADVQLSWNAIDDASYEVYTANSATAASWTKLGTSASPSYTIQGLVYGNTYYYKVRAVLSNEKYSNYSGVVQVPIALPAVSGLTASVSGQTGTLSWTALSGVKYYEVYSASSASATSWRKVGTSASAAFTANNLAYGSTTFYKVRALFTNGKYSNYSDAVQVSIPLPTVSGLSAEVSDQTAVLTWTALTGVRSYEIYSGDSPSAATWKKLGTSTKATFTIKNLTYGSTCYYKVRALLTTGKYSYESDVLTVPVPPNVTGLKAVLSGQIAQLSWDALSNAVSYEIYLAYPAKTLSWQKLGTSESASFTAQDLLYGVMHYFKVRALFNDGTYSSYSAVVQVPVAIPTVSGLTASADGRTVQLSWTELSGIQSYEIALCTSTRTSTCKKTGTSDSAAYTVNDLIYGGTYYFSVRALLNSGKYSNYSNVAQAVIETPAVSGLTGSAIEQTVSLSWEALDCVKYYEVYYANSSAPNTWRRLGTTTGTAITAKNMVFGTTCYFKVRALFTNGKYSDYSNVFDTPILFPSISGVTATVSKQTVQLTWDLINSAVSYEVSRSASESTGYKVLKTFKGTSYTDTGLSYGQTYYYRVRARINNGKYTDYCNPVQADIEEEKVTGLSVSASGQTSAHLSWKAKSTAVSYEIYRAASANSTYEKIGTSATTDYDDSGLTYGQTYSYKVRALCGSRYSEFSDPASVTIKLKVAGFSASPCGNTVCASLQWTALSDAVSYDIYRSTSAASGYTKIGSSAVNSYSDSGVSLRQTYYYKVQAVLNGSVYSEYSDTASAVITLKVTGLDSTTTLSWTGMPDAVLYEICRSDSANGSCTKTDSVTETSYTDSGVVFGQTYYYKVRAKLSNGEYSDYSDTLSLTVSTSSATGVISKDAAEELAAAEDIPSIESTVGSTAALSDPMSFFWLGNDFLNNPNHPEMPATGFPTGHFTPLPSVSTASITPTGITLRIPTLNLNAEVTALGLNEQTKDYDVSALDNRLGYLEGTAIPGQGFSILVGHNHLNTMEAGPFANLHEMEVNDRLFITDAADTMTAYSIYANLLIDANDYRAIADNAHENTLILITCEDETPEGSYIHRRVIFADPLG